MEIERVTHYVDNVLTQAEARMGLRNTRLLVAWYTNQKNDQSVVHSHPYHELVLPIGGSTTLTVWSSRSTTPSGRPAAAMQT